MTANQIRQAYLEFFTKKDHHQIKRSSLVPPNNDATTLFVSSGMQPLVPYLLGEKHPEGKRLVDSQTCLRAQDINEVGDNRHTTFFEMLGNWSLGDYFKEEQLNYFWDFLINQIKLNPAKLYITCFSGNKKYHIPKDETSALIWQELFKKQGLDHEIVDIGSESNGYEHGMQNGRIFYYDETKNWWCRANSMDDMPVNEPGGPDSEVFYLFDFIEHDQAFGQFCHPNCDCGRFMEIGNSVFMEYLKTEQGFSHLPNKNVDFGGGLERVAAASINSSDIFKIDLFWPIIEKIEVLSSKSYDSFKKSMRIIADHLKATVFLANDGVVPSNKAQGYVMRRLMRRAIRYGFELGIESNFFNDLVDIVIDIYGQNYPELHQNHQNITQIFEKEEKIFRQSLKKGLRQFDKIVQDHSTLNGQDVFLLYDTFGFPIELVEEEVSRQDYSLDSNWRQTFDQLMTEQREKSRTASKGMFKGGLGGHDDIHKKYHTATHLMYQALRQVLGDHVIQHGANITEERIRFDFSHPKKLTPQEISQVEDIVNQQIKEDLKVSYKEYPLEVALNDIKALGSFNDRYGQVVKVYTMTKDGQDHPFSQEICGGPHVEHTGQLAEGGAYFKIIKEESSSAGVRRIKAILTK